MHDISLDHYLVVGNPIAHSKSPLIHTEFAKQTQQAIHYEALLIDTSSGAFATAVNAFRANGGKGLNVTVPFKQAAWEFVQHRSERAKRAGAVNTIGFNQQGESWGDNTDGVGLVRDLTQNQGKSLTGQRILLLGAGGAVRGVLEPILAEKPASCVIANRTLEKAQVLVSLFAEIEPLSACTYDALAGQQFDIIINGTSASLQGELPPLPDNIIPAKRGWCYDMMYAATRTPFVQWALEHGAICARDGLGMLVEQAAESFYLWRGVRPKTEPVIEHLRYLLQQSVITAPQPLPPEYAGSENRPEPTRFGDWEKSGRCIDF
ncbi:shikimate dehydrogenase [Beggiatoa leptomitoformis]|uniref:Shikimate dehydrogenase (NADP(+)) n=1 Tax=Beggiatoa leptomitoformis TaxID=288004 RepID=A0A2N9YE21_9GAMM|nr:shikimate dehydrogenase [Beggiatoa leptomitoformis]ALG68890.1 shikimate dehydrogenase [Beggiatoa leptomitoformis]AUI68737.1 shikimate dehydrogenase [Beggiatoa leptomitoformis]